jgi:hypothetical protein
VEKVATNIPADRDFGPADQPEENLADHPKQRAVGRVPGASSTLSGAGYPRAKSLPRVAFAARRRTFIPPTGLSTWRGTPRINMTEAGRLRDQAARCQRLADEAIASDVVDAMRELAAYYVARARGLEHEHIESPPTASTRQQAPEPD